MHHFFSSSAPGISYLRTNCHASLPLYKNEAFACPFKERPRTIIKVKTGAKENTQNSSASLFSSCSLLQEQSVYDLGYSVTPKVGKLSAQMTRNKREKSYSRLKRRVTPCCFSRRVLLARSRSWEVGWVPCFLLTWKDCSVARHWDCRCCWFGFLKRNNKMPSL